MRLSGKRIVILCGPDYEDMELHYPRYRLMEEGADVVVAGIGPSDYKGKKGYPITVDAQIADLNPNDFDAVVVPGGYAPDHMRRSDELLRFVRAMDDQGKTIAAICHAAWVTVSAGIMKARRATCVQRRRHQRRSGLHGRARRRRREPDNLAPPGRPPGLPPGCNRSDRRARAVGGKQKGGPMGEVRLSISCSSIEVDAQLPDSSYLAPARALHPWSRNTFRGAATDYLTTREPFGFLPTFRPAWADLLNSDSSVVFCVAGKPQRCARRFESMEGGQREEWGFAVAGTAFRDGDRSDTVAEWSLTPT